MGTRADFYVGTGKEAEWLGSIAWDGYPDGNPAWALEATTEGQYRERVEELMNIHEITPTRASEGWPWPWEDSHTTAYAYTWSDGAPRLTTGRAWETVPERAARQHEGRGLPEGRVEFPDMSSRRMGAAGILAKSGLVIAVERR